MQTTLISITEKVKKKGTQISFTLFRYVTKKIKTVRWEQFNDHVKPDKKSISTMLRSFS